MKTWKTGGGQTVTKVLGGRSNVFLLSEGERKILVDTSPQAFRKNLDRRLCRLWIRSLDYLVLTHSHYDHAGNANRIKEKYGATVIVHRSESRYLAAGYTDGKDVLPAGTNVLTRFLTDHFVRTMLPLLRYEPCAGDILVDDVYDLHEAGFDARIMHTPGHTAGSLSLVVGDRLALVGDAMFGVYPGLVFPPFATDVPELARSWARLLATPCAIFLPSHGRQRSRNALRSGLERLLRRISRKKIA